MHLYIEELPWARIFVYTFNSTVFCLLMTVLNWFSTVIETKNVWTRLVCWILAIALRFVIIGTPRNKLLFLTSKLSYQSTTGNSNEF
ncbi:unnamed protein product [Caenorhabditis brenneri]